MREQAFTLGCTGKPLKRLKVRDGPSPPRSITRRGDWYAILIYTAPQQLILCVGEKTPLPALIPARGPMPR